MLKEKGFSLVWEILMPLPHSSASAGVGAGSQAHGMSLQGSWEEDRGKSKTYF